MTYLNLLFLSIFIANALYSSEAIPSREHVHSSLMTSIAEKNITNAGEFVGLTVNIAGEPYNISKVAFLDDRQNTKATVSFYDTMRGQSCYALLLGDDKWSYFHENHTSHNGILKDSEAVRNPKTFTEGDRCKFFGEITATLFTYHTRIEGGGILIGFNKMDKATKPSLSAADIHQALLPTTVQKDSEVMVEGKLYIVNEYIVVDEREEGKFLPYNEFLNSEGFTYELKPTTDQNCPHFLAKSPVSDTEANVEVQNLLDLKETHQYHFQIQSSCCKLQLLIGLEEKTQDMTDGPWAT